MTPIITELQWRRIRVPLDANTRKTWRSTCFMCSAYRVKHDAKCMRVDILGDKEAHIFCHHCTYEDWITA